MPLTPEDRETVARRFHEAWARERARAAGALVMGGPPLGSYAEDFPEIQCHPELDPTREPWWGREDSP